MNKLNFSDEQLAKAICFACGEIPEHNGDARGNAYRWQDYLPCIPSFKEYLLIHQTKKTPQENNEQNQSQARFRNK